MLTAAASAIVFTQWGLYARRGTPSEAPAPSRGGLRASQCAQFGLLACMLVLLPAEATLVRSTAMMRQDVSERTLRRAVELQPTNYHAQMWLALRLALDGRCIDAAPHVQLATAMQPFASTPHLLAASCHVAIQARVR